MLEMLLKRIDVGYNDTKNINDCDIRTDTDNYDDGSNACYNAGELSGTRNALLELRLSSPHPTRRESIYDRRRQTLIGVGFEGAP